MKKNYVSALTSRRILLWRRRLQKNRATLQARSACSAGRRDEKCHAAVISCPFHAMLESKGK